MASVDISTIGVATSPRQHSYHRRIYLFSLIIADGLMLVLAFMLAHWLRFDAGFTVAPEVDANSVRYGSLVIKLVPMFLGLFALMRLYDYNLLLGGTTEYSRVFTACSVGMMGVVMITFLEPTFVIARGWLTMAWLLSVLLVIASRLTLRRLAYQSRAKGLFLAPALVVGANPEALALLRQLHMGHHAGFHIYGVVASRSGEGEWTTAEERDGLPLLGTLDDLPDLIRRFEITEIIVATTALHRAELMEIFEQVTAWPNVNLRLSSGMYEVLTTGVSVNMAGSVPLMTLNRLRLDRLETILKTALDFSIALAGLIVLTPVLFVIGLMVRLDSPGPAVYRRRVLGVGGREFDAFKFRTMYMNGDEILAQYRELQAELAATHKLKDDPRVTRVGKWLRRMSLDELPQLLNVLMGQMSLVGPRMITTAETEQYGQMRYNLLTVKPGITGLWQVSGRSDVDYAERVRMDMYYIRNYSIWTDLQILFVQTPRAVLKRDGAY